MESRLSQLYKMSDQNPISTPLTPSGTTSLPVAAIICIAIGAYVVIIVILLIVRQMLMQRGLCGPVQCCGKEGEPCCSWCLACGEACNCCASPNLEGCLDSICPTRRQTECSDVILCKCFTDPENECCHSDSPICDCGNCNCNCQCNVPECEDCNCLCFNCKVKEPPPMDDDD